MRARLLKRAFLALLAPCQRCWRLPAAYQGGQEFLFTASVLLLEHYYVELHYWSTCLRIKVFKIPKLPFCRRSTRFFQSVRNRACYYCFNPCISAKYLPYWVLNVFQLLSMLYDVFSAVYFSRRRNFLWRQIILPTPEMYVSLSLNRTWAHFFC